MAGAGGKDSKKFCKDERMIGEIVGQIQHLPRKAMIFFIDIKNCEFYWWLFLNLNANA